MNRLDLGETTVGCAPQQSEARFVFAALRPGTSTPLPLNVIIEYHVNGTRAGEPSAWHALGALHGAEYAPALEALTRSFTDDLPSLGQVRTSENLASAGGKLVPTALTNTVADTLDGTPELSAHLQAHAGEIFKGDNAVSPRLSTAFSSMPKADFRWSSPDVEPQTRHLFALGTCNGCHAGEREDTSVLPFAPPTSCRSAPVRSSGGSPAAAGRRRRRTAIATVAAAFSRPPPAGPPRACTSFAG